MKSEKLEDLSTYMGSKEASKLLHLTERHVNQLAKQGELPARKFGRKWLFNPELLVQIINDQMKKSLKR